MLQGFQIKLDIPLKNKDDPPEKPGAKYIWFSSSSKKGGTGSGSPVHLAGNPSARVVYVIEGLLKADISHCLTGRTFAAIAGANNTSPLDAMFALLAQSGTEEIIEAHDMDKYNNKMTMAGASKIYLMAQKHGMNCRRLTWNPNYKGFDDWQLALRQGSQRQKEIEKLSFKEQYLRGLCKLAHIEDCVEQWQHRAEQDIGLTEYLGLTGEEHKTFLCGGRDALAALLEPQRRKQRFVLYQLQLDEENAIPFAFKDITALKAAGYEQPPAAMYYVAGSGEIYCPAEESDDTLLKRLFADCRERLPEGCRGRPMAVSDVVELNHGAKRAYYYVSGQDQFRQVKFSPYARKEGNSRKDTREVLMVVVSETKESQLLALLEQCVHLDADVRPRTEKGFFTVTVPPPWNGPARREAQAIQDQIKEWSKQYPNVVCYCFDGYSTLVYVL